MCLSILYHTLLNLFANATIPCIKCKVPRYNTKYTIGFS